MNYELTYDEVKKLIGDLILEITALKRDNIRLSEQLQEFNKMKEAQVRMPMNDYPVVDTTAKRESNG